MTFFFLSQSSKSLADFLAYTLLLKRRCLDMLVHLYSDLKRFRLYTGCVSDTALSVLTLLIFIKGDGLFQEAGETSI